MHTEDLRIEDYLPATLTAPGLSETEFLKLAGQFPDCFLEYGADGTVFLMPPNDIETSIRVAQAGAQLWAWAESQKRGIVVGPGTGFFFPGGSRRSPNAAWFDAERWKRSQQAGTRFPVFAPEFLIEVRSPEQRLRPLREKTDEYIANGVQLAWLIDPIEHTVEIYRPGRAPEFLTNPKAIAGEGPVDGFVLDLSGILI